jgi:hypothetical protein
MSSRGRPFNRNYQRGKLMGFTAVVHFSGAGIVEITRENGKIKAVRSLFPQSRGSHCGPHTTRLSFLGRYLAPTIVQRLEHRIIPDAYGAALMTVDLVDATLVSSAVVRKATVKSDLPPSLSENPSLKQLWDATSALGKIKTSKLLNDYAAIVEIASGALGSEDPIPGNWEDDKGPISSPNDRLTVTIQCRDKLTIDVEPLPIDLMALPGETIHLSFTNLPVQIYDPNHIHFGVLEQAMETRPTGKIWPKRKNIPATNPPPWCPYVRYEIAASALAAPPDGSAV